MTWTAKKPPAATDCEEGQAILETVESVADLTVVVESLNSRGWLPTTTADESLAAIRKGIGALLGGPTQGT